MDENLDISERFEKLAGKTLFRFNMSVPSYIYLELWGDIENAVDPGPRFPNTRLSLLNFWINHIDMSYKNDLPVVKSARIEILNKSECKNRVVLHFNEGHLDVNASDVHMTDFNVSAR